MRLFFIYSLFFILISCSPKKETKQLSMNPITIPMGDPYILYNEENSTYYMYGTSGINGFKTYSSTNLNDWTDEGVVYQGATPDSWTKDCFWAPEVYKRDGKYYLWFSANWKENPNNEGENFRIGVAVADKPTGPFIELNNAPVFDPGYPIIDANILFDDKNNKTYLYYSRCCYKNPVKSEISEWAKEQGFFDEIEESWIYGVELKPDFSGVIGEPTLLLRPPVELSDNQSEWESRSVTSKEINRRWTEGSFIFNHNNSYYMMYSANYFGGQNYAVGYATSEHPLGPFKKAENNPVLQKNTLTGGNVTGTGHNMVLNMPDNKKMCVYHARTNQTGDDRLVFIDELIINVEGKLVVLGPSVK